MKGVAALVLALLFPVRPAVSSLAGLVNRTAFVGVSRRASSGETTETLDISQHDSPSNDNKEEENEVLESNENATSLEEEYPFDEELYLRKTPRRLARRLHDFRYKSWLWVRDYVRQKRNQMTLHERNVVNIYKRTLPAVAELKVYHEHKEYTGELQEGEVATVVSSSTGFLWDEQGHVVTAYHCLFHSEHFMEVYVRFPGMFAFFEAEVVGTDKGMDIAVMMISPKQRHPALSSPLKMLAKPIPKGHSDALQVGQSCLAIGAPRALTPYVLTTGIVTGLNQVVPIEAGPDHHGCIQTDDMLRPGNSGGPLLDSQGRLIGINFSGDADIDRLGYAIPVDIVKRVVSQIIQHGSSAFAQTGVVLAGPALQDEIQEISLGRVIGGVMIAKVFQDSPAHVAGLREHTVMPDGADGPVTLFPRDLVVGVDGKRVTKSDEVLGITAAKFPGETVLFTVSRAAKVDGPADERWEEIIPIKLVSYDDLLEMSDEFRQDAEDTAEETREAETETFQEEQPGND